MPDYQELYLDMVRASERAIRELIKAQQLCEEKIVLEADALSNLSTSPEAKKNRT
ncbi:MAG: hypothetical protein RR350_06620 [Oscillibacter sp.]